VPDILVVTDSERVLDEVSAAVGGPGTNLRWARQGAAVLPALQESPADLVVSDLQVGTMGGYALAMELALEAGAGRLAPVPVLLLLDRAADVFLAKRTGVAGWAIKPIDPFKLRAAVEALLAGGHYHGTAAAPGRGGLQTA
jgi:DNA-binding response OmpR family regulator